MHIPRSSGRLFAKQTFVVTAMLAVAAGVVAVNFDVAYAAKKPKHSRPPHTQQSASPTSGTQQTPSGPPDPGSYK